MLILCTKQALFQPFIHIIVNTNTLKNGHCLFKQENEAILVLKRHKWDSLAQNKVFKECLFDLPPFILYFTVYLKSTYLKTCKMTFLFLM